MGKRKQPEPVEPEPPCTNADRATARGLLTTALLKPVTKARANTTTPDATPRKQRQPSETAQACAFAAGLASRVEQAVNDRYGALGARVYFDRVRAIVTNVRLGDLGTRLATDTLTAVEAATMTSTQMATKETATKKQRALDKAVKGATRIPPPHPPYPPQHTSSFTLFLARPPHPPSHPSPSAARRIYHSVSHTFTSCPSLGRQRGPVRYLSLWHFFSRGPIVSGDALTIKTEKKEGGAKMEWVGNHDPDMVGPGARFAQAHDDLADDATDPGPGAAAADDDDTVTKYVAVGGKMRVTVGISATSKRRKEQQEGAEAAELIRRMNTARRQSVGASGSLLSQPGPPPAAAVAAASAAESPDRSEARARATLKLQAIDAVKPYLDPLYKAGRIGKAGYKQTLKRAVQELVRSGSGGKQWTAAQIAAAVDLADPSGTGRPTTTAAATAATAAAAAAAAATSAPTLRALSADAVITLSHVHCPRGTSAGQFRAAARWLLPRCRLREAANGQQFEHLHARIDSASESSYSYKPGNVGFEKQNVGRSAVLAPGSAADELMWFEEWRDWSGVAKHGETGASPPTPLLHSHRHPSLSTGRLYHPRPSPLCQLRGPSCSAGPHPLPITGSHTAFTSATRMGTRTGRGVHAWHERKERKGGRGWPARLRHGPRCDTDATPVGSRGGLTVVVPGPGCAFQVTASAFTLQWTVSSRRSGRSIRPPQASPPQRCCRPPASLTARRGCGRRSSASTSGRRGAPSGASSWPTSVARASSTPRQAPASSTPSCSRTSSGGASLSSSSKPMARPTTPCFRRTARSLRACPRRPATRPVIYCSWVPRCGSTTWGWCSATSRPLPPTPQVSRTSANRSGAVDRGPRA